MADLQTQDNRAVSENTWSHLRQFELDARDADFTQDNMDDLGETLELYTDPLRFLWNSTYRLKIASITLPDSYLRATRYLRLTQADFTGATALFDVPAGTGDNIDYVYIQQRISAASSMGTAGIADIPTTWRNMTGVFRFIIERQDLTEAQQLGILDGLEREILAGMSELYTSTSTTNRFIDFQSTSTGANAAITKAELQARGWTDVNVNQSEKFISSNGATARRWRVLHNA